PALEIIDITVHKGGKVTYHDPYIPTVKTNEGRTFSSQELTSEVIAKADCVVLTTNHKDFDVEFVRSNAKLIVDMRNMINESSDKVIKL
ncbi:MAG: UDP-N-acetyl-D-glucosamine dehydrogenase, partial [Bacteroidetes bacterium CG18_big_fil_WC_8_21_14_2_50_41_14]